MKEKFLLILLLTLPVGAEAVICKTVGEDGVVSYRDVPVSNCPVESRLPDYSWPMRTEEQAQSINTLNTDQEVTFIGYRHIRIASPETGLAVHSSNRRVLVRVELEPGLQDNHFIIFYLDNRAFRGRYGSSSIELTSVDPGTHTLRATVIDTKGKTVIESSESSFTLLLPQPRVKVTEVKSTIIEGTFDGVDVGGSEVTIVFMETGNEYYGVVAVDGTWKVKVPAEEKYNFDVKVRERTGGQLGLEFKGGGVKPGGFDPTYKSEFKPDYKSAFTPSYRSKDRGIATTPGRTNPAFRPRYKQ